MHTHLNFVFKRALHFSTSAMKAFTSNTKLYFKAIIVNAALKTSLLLNALPPVRHANF